MLLLGFQGCKFISKFCELVLSFDSLLLILLDPNKNVMCNIHNTSMRDFTINLVQIIILDVILPMEIRLQILITEWILIHLLIVWDPLILLCEDHDLLVSLHTYLSLLLVILIPNLIEDLQHLSLDFRIQLLPLIVILRHLILHIIIHLRIPMLINLVLQTFQ